MKLNDVVRVLEELAPLRYAESWDNVGLLVGDPDADVRRALVTVDYSPLVAAEARAKGAQLVVAYHPPIFAAVKRVPHDALWAQALRLGIALYSPHTALDVAKDGTNDFLADACGLSAADRRPLVPFAARDPARDAEGIGMGRIGEISPAPLAEITGRLKAALGLDYLLVSAARDEVVRRIAVVAGAGGSLLQDARSAGADLFVTGEVRHHDAQTAALEGVSVIATLHSNSERAAVRAYAARLAERLEGVEVSASEEDCDPFRVG